MKKSVTIIFSVCLLIITSECRNYPEGAITDFATLKNEFKQPSQDYGTVPFFVWNSKIWKALQQQDKPEIHITADFERGSIGSLKEIKENVFSGQTMHWIKKDKVGNQFYWFYFRMDNVRRKSLTVHLENMTGIYRNHTHELFTDYTQPVMSYDKKSWQRITDVNYDSATCFTFRFTPGKDTVWIAYAHPYTWSRFNAFVDSIGNNKYVMTDVIGKTREGRDIQLITITNPQKNNKDKKVVMMTALQHPGEDAGSYVLEGLIKALLSDGPEMRDIKDRFMEIHLMKPLIWINLLKKEFD